MIYLQLIYEFFKTGLFSIGGGLATLPFLFEVARKTDWFNTNDISNMLAISQSTPGAIGINMSTYVGFITSGPIGGIVATLALVAPSVIIIIFVSKILNKFKGNKYVEATFYGLRPASTALIASAGLTIFKLAFINADYKESSNLINIFNYKAIIFAALLYFVIKKTNKHPIVYIAASALIGIIFNFAA